MKPYEKLYDENGEYILDENYTEILRLDKMLTEANIPHTLERMMDGWCLLYPTKESAIADAIQHCGSYGSFANLLEIMGLLTPEEEQRDSVKGWLTADDVFKRMSEHYSQYADAYKKLAHPKGKTMTFKKFSCNPTEKDGGSNA